MKSEEHIKEKNIRNTSPPQEKSQTIRVILSSNEIGSQMDNKLPKKNTLESNDFCSSI